MGTIRWGRLKAGITATFRSHDGTLLTFGPGSIVERDALGIWHISPQTIDHDLVRDRMLIIMNPQNTVPESKIDQKAGALVNLSALLTKVVATRVDGLLEALDLASHKE